MSSKKPRPLIVSSKHGRCPVCGEISYSPAGVHPQCAVRQADAKRLLAIKKNKRSKETSKPPAGVKPWQRSCPRCNAVQHVRKRVCGCGYTFAVVNRQPATEGDLS
jgi:hypothetical protein